MQRAALVLAIALTIPATAVGQRRATPGVEQIVARLSGVEEGPSAREWRALGPGVVAILARIADDPQQPGWVRVRALGAAGAFATPSARAMLRRALRSREPLFVRAAARAMHRAFGAAALGDLVPLLDHEDPAVREAVVDALAAVGGAGARRALRARLARENDEALRDAIAAALADRHER